MGFITKVKDFILQIIKIPPSCEFYKRKKFTFNYLENKINCDLCSADNKDYGKCRHYIKARFKWHKI